MYILFNFQRSSMRSGEIILVVAKSIKKASNTDHPNPDLPSEWTWLLFDLTAVVRLRKLIQDLRKLLMHTKQAEKFIALAEQAAWDAFREEISC